MITVIWRSQTSPYTHTPHCSHHLDGTWDAPVLSVGNFSHGAALWTAPVVLVPGPPVRHRQWHCDCRGHDSQILGQTNPVFPWWLRWEKKKKKPACNAGVLGSIPGSERSPREGNGYLLQYSCLKNSKDRRAWQSMGLQKSLTRLSS